MARTRPLRHHARRRSRPLRAGDKPGLHTYAVRWRHVDGRPRVAVEALGEPRRPVEAVLVILLPQVARGVSGGFEWSRSRSVLSGPQRARVVQESGRG